MLPARNLDGTSKSKVDHQGRALAEENVFRLDVTVNNALAMGIAQRVRDFRVVWRASPIGSDSPSYNQWPGRELNPRHADFQSALSVPHTVLQ